MTNKCIIDIGSNTIKLFIANVVNNEVITLCSKRRVTLLAQGLAETGKLSLESRNLVEYNLKEYLQICSEYNVEPSNILVTATAAMRNSINGSEFAEEIKQKFNLRQIKILSGPEEAETSFLGAVISAKENSNSFFYVVDVGGGSIQVSSGTANKYHNGLSIQQGCNYAAEKFCLKSAIDETKLNEVISFYKNINVDNIIENTKPARVLCIGGSIKIVQLMIKPESSDAAITLKELKSTAKILSSISVKERYEWFCEKYPDEIYRKDAGLTYGRAEVILAGVCILTGILENLNLDEFIVCRTDAKDFLIRVM